MFLFLNCFVSETGLPSSDKEEGQPKVFDAGSFSFPTISFFLFQFYFSSQMKKKSLQKPSKKMDKMYKKMLEKQRLQKKREKYEKLHKAKKQQVPWTDFSNIEALF